MKEARLTIAAVALNPRLKWTVFMEWEEEDKKKAQEHYYLACGKKSTEAIQAFHSVLLLLFNQTSNDLQHLQRSTTIMRWMS